jgi:5-methylcytosine-specific restriction protein B
MTITSLQSLKRYTTVQKDDDFIELANQYYEDLEEINKLLPENLKFGYRVFDEIISFIINSENSLLQFTDNSEAFDIAVKMKILPRFHGTRDKLERVFDDILEFTESRGLFYTAKKIKKMQENLNNIGYTSFM